MYKSSSQKQARYSTHWQDTASFTRLMTLGRCADCFRSPRSNGRQVDVHHFYYGIRILGFTLHIPGFELPVIQVVPLCINCHLHKKGAAHRSGNYVSTNDVWTNHSVSSYVWRIRMKMLGKMICIWLLPLVAVGYFVLKTLGVIA